MKTMCEPTSARSLALSILMDWQKPVCGMRQPIGQVIEAHTRRFSLPSVEIALLHELVYGVLRHKTWLDWRINAFLHRKDIPLEVRTVLEICAFQIDLLDRIPVSAAVNEAVKAIKASRHAWASGLVNAVARRLAESASSPFSPSNALQDRLNALPELERLSILFSHPLWLLKRWERRLGLKGVSELCQWNNQKAGLCLRINSLKITRNEAINLLNQAGFAARPGDYSPQAVWLDDFFGNPLRLPGFAEGLFQVQDEAAQLVAYCLAPQPNDSILDLCAGLGGKTTHLAELAQDRARIAAYDISEVRLKGLMQNTARLGLNSIYVLKILNQMHQTGMGAMGFNKVLLDAPCSGLGTLRRHPDIKWNRTERFIGESAARQLELLNQAAFLLSPGGLLCYATCTVEPEETTEVLDVFLNSQPGVERVNPKTLLPPPAAKFITRDGYVHILLEQNGPDIFFMALLRKRSI